VKAQKTSSDSDPCVLETWDRLIEGLRKAGAPEDSRAASGSNMSRLSPTATSAVGAGNLDTQSAVIGTASWAAGQGALARERHFAVDGLPLSKRTSG
jgi:hypothetical protein